VTLTLTPDELVEVTGYVRGADQLRYFQNLGVPAHRRPDGTVSVCRQHYIELRRTTSPEQAPRPRLRSDENKTAAKGLRKTRLAVVR
jgi:hypothetical protein